MKQSTLFIFLKGRDLIISAFIIMQPYCLFSENLDSALLKININNKYFEKATEIFDLNIKHFKAIVLVERLLNYDWSDDALDEIFARVGHNSSIGFCQVKLKTAYWIEKQLNDSTSKFFPGNKYFGLLDVNKNPIEIMKKLQNDSLNIIYAGAYLTIINNVWKKSGYSIKNRADILGTLYSTGLYKPNGDLRKANANPKPNQFGKLVLKYLHLF